MGWVTQDHPTTDELNACVQCGLCLPACPTFRLTGRETASPRGRIQAMKAVHNGVLELDGPFQGVIDFCLGCRACEPVCPGWSRTGGPSRERAPRSPHNARTFGHRLRSFLLGTAIGSRRSLRFGSGALRMAQATRATSLAPARYRRLSEGVRPLGGRPEPTLGHEGGTGDSGAVALWPGASRTNGSGRSITPPSSCWSWPGSGSRCRAARPAAAHSPPTTAKRMPPAALAERNVPVLSGYDQVVVTSAGCSAHVREYGHWAEGGDEVGTRAIDVTVAVARAIEAGLLPALPEGREPWRSRTPVICDMRSG